MNKAKPLTHYFFYPLCVCFPGFVCNVVFDPFQVSVEELVVSSFKGWRGVGYTEDTHIGWSTVGVGVSFKVKSAAEFSIFGKQGRPLLELCMVKKVE